MRKPIYTIGVDEAGRGPIAGPVAVGVCKIKTVYIEELEDELINKFMSGKLKDSKKLSEKKREEIYSWIEKKKEENKLDFIVSMGSSKTIDDIGIVPTIKKAISKTLTALSKDKEDKVLVLLDGGLKAPETFVLQKTIIKGDESQIIISLASIVAKVTRDRYMKKLAKQYNKEGKFYGFERHKGYGTKVHHEMINKYGLCNYHRKSFCKSVR